MTAVAQIAAARLKRQARQGVEPWMSKQQIAAHLGFSARWVELRVAEGMPCTRMGGRLRFQVTHVEDWLRGRQRGRIGA